MIIFIPYFSSTAKSPGSYLIFFALASLISLIIVSILYSQEYSNLNQLQTYQCHIQKELVNHRLCTVQDCTKAQQFNIRNFEPPRMYDKEDAMTSSVKLDLFEYSSQHWKWQQQTCQSYESICYEAQWVVNYNSYLGVYTTISSGMISTSSEEASQVFALVVNQSVVPYYCYAKESISTFHWHASEFQVIIPRDWMIGVIVTSVLTALFVLMSVVYFVVWCYRRRRTNRKSKRSINGDSSEKQPLNVENGRKTPSSSASGKKKATTATKKTNSAVGIVRTTRVSLPQQQQQIPATSNVMVPPANTQYCYYTTSSTVVGNNYNNTDQGTVVYYNSGNNVVNHAQSSGANNQQQQPQQPQSMYTK